MILTIDLGTTNIKAALWSESGIIAVGRCPVATTHPGVDRAEQDTASWWPAVVQACASLPDRGRVAAIGLCSARQTFVAVDRDFRPLGPAILWSDRRAPSEADALAEAAGGVEAVWQRTGMVLDAGSVAAKLAGFVDKPAWFLGPRDYLLARLTGRVATDWTQASATGLYDHTGTLDPTLAGGAAECLPSPADPDTIAGSLLPAPADEIGVASGTPVVVGAGDRQCEVLGSGASTACPMVSWGTTANVSVPVGAWPSPMIRGLVVTRAAPSGWQIEGGLSAAGALIDWLSRVTGQSLWPRAAQSPPGARGVINLPWLGGARAPWWRSSAGASFLGLSPAHDVSDLARAAVEGVAWEVERCVRAVGGAEALVMSGGGSDSALWASVLGGITGLPTIRRATPEAALAGAALLAASAIGSPWSVDNINPRAETITPPVELVALYAELRSRVMAAAEAVVSL